MLNGKEHLIKFIGNKDTNILVELETKSAYPLLDKIVLKFEQERVDKKTTNNVKIAYKADAFQLNTIYDNGKPKEGLIMVQTPWETYKTMKVGFLFNYDPKQDISASVSKSAKRINNNNNNDDDDVSNMKQYSRLGHIRNNFNSNRNSNSNSNNKNIKVIDARIKGIDQSHQTADNTTG